MKTITIRKGNHRGKAVYFIFFTYNKSFIKLLKEIKSRWSQSKRSWYIPQTRVNLDALFTMFKRKTYLHLDWKYNDSSDKNSSPFLEKVTTNTVRRERNISEDYKTIMRAYAKYLEGKRYSKSTIGVYFTFIADFIDYINDKKLNDLTVKDVELFIEDIFVPKKMSISSQRQFISALKLFIIFYPDAKIDNLKLQRPKKSTYLPVVLSQQEVLELIRSAKNLKHRAIITLLYSLGLRVGELLNLKLNDIDIERGQILIKNGKGRKDRYVVLATSFLPLLKNYISTFIPTNYFVENLNKRQYSASSIRKFIHRYTKSANISKKVTPHTLRHSYATHLLENGTGLRYIQELLGHSRPETTMIYTHVAKKDLLEIHSPLDTIILSLGENDKKEQNFLLSRNKNL